MSRRVVNIGPDLTEEDHRKEQLILHYLLSVVQPVAQLPGDLNITIRHATRPLPHTRLFVLTVSAADKGALIGAQGSTARLLAKLAVMRARVIRYRLPVDVRVENA